MNCTVRYSNGEQEENYDTIQQATASLLARWPDGVVCDAGGFEVNEYTDDLNYDIRSGRIALVWPDEATSINDDGALAVASINTADAD